MVMVIMTVLGLSFLMVSDTENKISVNDRDGRQVLYIAMAGAKLVESWFNVPDPTYNPFLPRRTDCELDLRVGDSDYDGVDDIDVPTNGTAQRYRGGTATGVYRLFDKPFRGAVRDTFWGTRETPDVLISNDPDADDDYLDTVVQLFNQGDSPTLEGLQIDEVRIWAPPYDDDLQQRHGICTASVTASKILVTGDTRRRVAERTVTIVLQELPFPAPGAAIESAGNIDISGNFGVHWGGAYTEADTAVQNGSNFPGPAVPRENTSRYRFANFAPDAPDLDLGTGGTQNLITQLLAGGGFEIADPWINFRCDGHILEAGTNNDDQPWPYDYSTGLDDDRSIFFQNQTYAFPELSYEFWKSFTMKRSRNTYYLKYVGSDEYKRNGIGTAYKMAHWANTENPGIDAGIFFFDTSNNLNPQDGGPGILAPDYAVNSGEVDSPSGDIIFEGMIYTNIAVLGSSGISGSAVTRTVNMPSEPFLDTGIDIDGDGVVGNTLAEQDTIGNGVWDFAWLGVDDESQGSYYDELYGTVDFEDFAQGHRVADGIVPHAGDDGRVGEAVNHEPFLNLAYPAQGAPADPLRVDYDIEETVPRNLGGDRDMDGTIDTLTSVRDPRGALVDLDLVVNGIWYNQGGYDGSGNLPVYGSMLMRTGFEATGTPNIRFNEGILLGDFPPPEMQIPRVYVSQFDTED
jgi:hypothetical protein